MSELNLVATEDLLKELVRRTDNIVVVGEKVLDEGTCEVIHTINGDPLKCLGLVELIKLSIMPEAINTNYEG